MALKCHPYQAPGFSFTTYFPCLPFMPLKKNKNTHTRQVIQNFYMMQIYIRESYLEWSRM